jgi:methylenetetrahydrofolate dehydrogenase (NADP+)/methenyltetrahydrofolate cyclohydrolase
MTTPLAGAKAAIVGRDPTLGRPLSILLSLKELGANEATSKLHSGVANLADQTRRIDIAVAAVGIANMITASMIRSGAVVIAGGLTWEGKKAFSEVDVPCAETASWVTPRLGGVGVTTVAMLLANTVSAAERSLRPVG